MLASGIIPGRCHLVLDTVDLPARLGQQASEPLGIHLSAGLKLQVHTSIPCSRHRFQSSNSGSYAYLARSPNLAILMFPQFSGLFVKQLKPSFLWVIKAKCIS